MPEGDDVKLGYYRARLKELVGAYEEALATRTAELRSQMAQTEKLKKQVAELTKRVSELEEGARG